MSRRAVRRTARSRKARLHPSAASPAKASLDGVSRGLRAALFAALGLLLLTPFVVSSGTVYPYIVGKALWARALIEIAFALWVLLALRHRAYRPPRAWLLMLAAAGLGVSVLSAAVGVSPEYSFWSSYERMHGVIDQAHWVALAFVLASTVRGDGAWRVLLGAHAAAGAATALIVIARASNVEVPFYGQLPEFSATRLGGPLGNPTVLSACMLANLGLAAAFCAREAAQRFVPGAVGWAAVGLLHLAGLVLAGSVGGFVGLIGAAAFAAVAHGCLGRGRRRIAAAAVLVTIAVGCAGLGARFVDSGAISIRPVDRTAAAWPGAAALRYVAQTNIQRPSVQSRLASWEAGLKGFSARPLLGWGPGNYNAVFGLYGTGYAATAPPHDLAHGKLVEVAATTGVAGLLAWVALWGLALAVPVLGARAMAAPDRAFAILAAAALAGNLVQVQFLFDTVSGTLFTTVLLAYAARLESRALPQAWRLRLPARANAWIAGRLGMLPRRGTRVVLATAVVALTLWGLAVNRSILSAADNRHVGSTAVPTFVTAEGIEAFTPLAGTYRLFLFSEVTRIWAAVRAAQPELARRLLEWVDREATAAVRSEPLNWRFEHMLAQLYRAVADTDSTYEDRARRHLARAMELAPARDPFPAPLEPPVDLAAVPVPGGTAAGALESALIELRWRPSSPGAGYHRIGVSTEPASWSTVQYIYDPDRRSLLAPACEACAYRIQACRTRSDCSDWAVWP